MKKRRLTSRDDAKALEHEIRCASECAFLSIRRITEESDGLGLLQAVKFEKIGRDPFDPKRPLNLIEQVNQTFTALVSVQAANYLFDHHPDAAPFFMNLGTARGPDIVSEDGSVVAEVFSATHPDSNDKKRKDIDRVSKEVDASHRYVFFHCPGDYACEILRGVKVVPLGLK
ncbi:MAG: hypothetical protein OXI17_08410 [Gammaproteobacteria bacterium]|nr:hypothetical protein [Gammaproteobacteria bacterium]